MKRRALRGRGNSLFAMLVLLLATGVAFGQTSQPQYFAGTGHWYQYLQYTPSLCWTVSQNTAGTRGGYLATVLTAEENNFIANLTSPYTAWLGGLEPNNDGVWKWVTNESWSYTSWAFGEPNNTGGNENFLAIGGISGPLGWNDGADCNPPVGMVVEYNFNPDSTAWCDDFEDGSGWQSRWESVVGVQDLVSSPTHSGGGALRFYGSYYGNCHSSVYRKNFLAGPGEYTGWFRQEHFAAGLALFVQVQPDTDTTAYADWKEGYRIGYHAMDAQQPAGVWVHRLYEGTATPDTLLGQMQPQFVMNEWVRAFVRIMPSGIIVVGYERSNGFRDSMIVTDPNPLQSPGRFYVSSCADFVSSSNLWDDMCYQPLCEPAPLPYPAVAGASETCFGEWAPSWSPDGQWLAFTSNKHGNFGIFKIPAGGGSPIRLTDSPFTEFFPSWSPDGSKILFSRDGSAGTTEIWEMNADGSNQHALTTGYKDGEPSYSPCGDKILFGGWRPPTSDYGIFVMDPDGSNIQWLGQLGAHPKWSGDCSKIAFENYYQFGVWVMDADGSNAHVCSPTLNGSNDGGGGISWAPCSCGKLVYTTGDYFEDPYPNLSIIDARACAEPTQVTSIKSCTTPAWSPDGKKIAFTYVDPANPEGDICILDASAFCPPSSNVVWFDSTTIHNGFIQVMIKNTFEVSAFTIPLLHNSPFVVDSVSNVDCRTAHWQSFYGTSYSDSRLLIGGIADMGGGIPCMPVGEGPVARIYFNRACFDTYTVALDTAYINEPGRLLITDCSISPVGYTPVFIAGTGTYETFLCGDINADCHRNIADVVYLIRYIFTHGAAPLPEQAGDVDGDCIITIADAVYYINWIFVGGAEPVCGCINSGPFAKQYSGAADVDYSIESGSATTSLTLAANCDRAIRGVQLEFNIVGDANVVDVTSTFAGLQEFHSTIDGLFKVGLLDMTGKAVIPAGQHDFVRISYIGKGEFMLASAIVVGEDASKMNVRLSSQAATTSLPTQFALHQNTPNPFNPTTEIGYALPKASSVRLEVLNVLGQVVRTLVDEFQTAGNHQAVWDGRDNSHQEVSSGVYFYRIVAGEYAETRKMVLMK